VHSLKKVWKSSWSLSISSIEKAARAECGCGTGGCWRAGRMWVCWRAFLHRKKRKENGTRSIPEQQQILADAILLVQVHPEWPRPRVWVWICTSALSHLLISSQSCIRSSLCLLGMQQYKKFGWCEEASN